MAENHEFGSVIFYVSVLYEDSKYISQTYTLFI